MTNKDAAGGIAAAQASSRPHAKSEPSASTCEPRQIAAIRKLMEPTQAGATVAQLTTRTAADGRLFVVPWHAYTVIAG